MAILGPFDFRGGYSPGYDFPVLPQGKGYLTTMENTRITGGSAAPRWARVNVNDATLGAAQNVNGLVAWNDTVNSKLAIVAVCNSKINIADASGYTVPGNSFLTFTDRTGAVAASSVSGLVTFDSLNNILVGSANSASSGVLFKVTAYNANAAVLAGTPPSADIVKQVNNFMFASRNLSATTTQSKVYWSNVNDPETWSVANVLDFNKNDGEPIMALGSIGTDLYIFKKNSIGRLSTVTITISGAVTLGPLVTVIRGVGCAGPRALDNLPNGNIVFLSYDGHLYEFDGSSLVDLSRSAYPDHNVYDAGQTRSTFSNVGLYSCQANTNSNVKVCRGINEIWISFSGSITPGARTFAYNFEQRTWQGIILKGVTLPTSPDLVMYSLTTLPLPPTFSIILESTESFLYGDANGTVWVSGDTFNQQPGDRLSYGSSTLSRFSIGTTVHLMTPQGPFIPRSICFEIFGTSWNGNNAFTLNFYADYDVFTPIAAALYSTSGNPFPTRVFVNLPFYQDTVGTNIFPTFISLLWTGQGPSISSSTLGGGGDMTRIGHFYLSDEVIR